MAAPFLQFNEVPAGYKGEVKLIDGHLVPWPPLQARTEEIHITRYRKGGRLMCGAAEGEAITQMDYVEFPRQHKGICMDCKEASARTA